MIPSVLHWPPPLIDVFGNNLALDKCRIGCLRWMNSKLLLYINENDMFDAGSHTKFGVGRHFDVLGNFALRDQQNYLINEMKVLRH